MIKICGTSLHRINKTGDTSDPGDIGEVVLNGAHITATVDTGRRYIRVRIRHPADANWLDTKHVEVAEAVIALEKAVAALMPPRERRQVREEGRREGRFVFPPTDVTI